jgi:hypothetical protein
MHHDAQTQVYEEYAQEKELPLKNRRFQQIFSHSFKEIKNNIIKVTKPLKR